MQIQLVLLFVAFIALSPDVINGEESSPGLLKSLIKRLDLNAVIGEKGLLSKPRQTIKGEISRLETNFRINVTEPLANRLTESRAKMRSAWLELRDAPINLDAFINFAIRCLTIVQKELRFDDILLNFKYLVEDDLQVSLGLVISSFLSIASVL